MKNISLVILILFYFTNLSYSKEYKINTMYQTNDFIIFEVKTPIIGNNKEKGSRAKEIMWNKSKEHCAKQNKKSLYFNTDYHAVLSNWSEYRYRYYCANNVQEAYDIFTRRHQDFKASKPKTKLKYFSINNSEEKFVYTELRKIKERDEKIAKEKNRKLQEEKARRNKIISEQKRIAKEKLDEENKISKCQNYGFKKGTEKFADCIFKLSQAQLELERLKIQKENQKQLIILEKEKLKAAEAQAEAAKAQAEAARRNAEANESSAATADAERRQKMRDKGLKSLSGKCSLLKGDC